MKAKARLITGSLRATAGIVGGIAAQAWASMIVSAVVA